MLNAIVAAKRQEVADSKRRIPLAELQNSIEPGKFAFSRVLTGQDWSLIAECKLHSPAKGRLCQQYSVPELAAIYTQHGAAALSVHTDQHFKGRLSDIRAVRAVSSLPILRKDFIIDEYQLFEARSAGADAVLLIAAILTDDMLSAYLEGARQLGLDSLVEVHTRQELERVIRTPATLLGINNRDLNNFSTNIANTFELLPYCPAGCTIISESGVRTAADAVALQTAGVKGILVGEGLVKAADIGASTRQLALLE